MPHGPVMYITIYSQRAALTGRPLQSPRDPGRIGSRAFPTNHEPLTTNNKKALEFSSAFFTNQRLPILPGGLPPSTFGVCGLNCCVRHGNRWIPAAIATELFGSGFSYPDNCIKMFFLTGRPRGDPYQSVGIFVVKSSVY